MALLAVGQLAAPSWPGVFAEGALPAGSHPNWRPLATPIGRQQHDTLLRQRCAEIDERSCKEAKLPRFRATSEAQQSREGWTYLDLFAQLAY